MLNLVLMIIAVGLTIKDFFKETKVTSIICWVSSVFWSLFSML